MPTILVVDDDAAIRQLMTRLLERSGHRVIACQSAAEALAVAEPVDLLLADLVLPETNGRELAEALRERRPGLPVVLMSGYFPQRDRLPGPPSVFLQKPMKPSAVVKAVEGLLA